MDHRLIQPASRDQIVAIIRQRAERANLQRDLPAHLGQVSAGGNGPTIYVVSLFFGGLNCANFKENLVWDMTHET